MRFAYRSAVPATLIVDGHSVPVLAAVRPVIDTWDLSQRHEGHLWSTAVTIRIVETLLDRGAAAHVG